eukprot:scaffold418_cov92-Skeletonema_dohrnii-CCMP3373.AAC.3
MGRKRNQGKARKAAKAKAREEAEEESRNDNDNESTSGQHQPLAALMEQVENNYENKCLHGVDIDRLSMADVICVEFAKAFQKIFYHAADGGMNVPDCLQSAHNATLDKFAEVWNDSAKMEIAISLLLCIGTDHFLEDNFDHARDCATIARYLEEYIAVLLKQTQALMNWPKINEVYDADLHTLVKLFRKRIPCCCLDEKYEEVKSTPKMGYCFNPDCPIPCGYVERSKTMYCSRCRNVTYCSPECQRTHWPRHKPLCDMKAAVKAEFDAKQQNA